MGYWLEGNLKNSKNSRKHTANLYATLLTPLKSPQLLYVRIYVVLLGVARYTLE